MMTAEESPGAMFPTRANEVMEYLEGAGIAYELVEHEPVMSASAEAEITHEAPDHVAKTVVLHDGGGYVIAAVSAAHRLDLHKLRDVLGSSRKLQLATEEEIAREFPLVEVGALPPFGPVTGAEVIDQSLLRHERILCPAGDHRHSVLVDPHDVLKITAAKVADIHQD